LRPVAGIGNSRSGVLDAYNPQRKYGAFLVEGFISSLFSHSGPACLADFTMSRALAAPFADTNLIFRWSDYCMNLMGAPAMPVWVPSGSGVEENHKPQAASIKPGPTIVRGVLRLAIDERRVSHAAPSDGGRCGQLVDISGRKVIELRPGANDVTALAPGVYFVKEARAQRRAQAIRKVIVAR
jgi:hypothetical protein